MNKGAEGDKKAAVPKMFQQFEDQENSKSSSDFQSDDDYGVCVSHRLPFCRSPSPGLFPFAPAWIPWFCSLKGNEFFCEVDDSFAQVRVACCVFLFCVACHACWF